MAKSIVPPRHGITEDHWPCGWMADGDVVAGCTTYLLRQCQREGVQSIRPISVGMVELKIKNEMFKVTWECFYQGLREGGMTLPWRLFGFVMCTMLDMKQRADGQSRSVVRVGNSVVYDVRRRSFLLDN